MSIKTQRKILYIPIVNFIIAFCLLGRCFRFKIKKIWLFKKYALMLAGILIITLLNVLLDRVIDNLVVDNIIFYVSVYFHLFVIISSRQ